MSLEIVPDKFRRERSNDSTCPNELQLIPVQLHTLCELEMFQSCNVCSGSMRWDLIDSRTKASSLALTFVDFVVNG